MKDLLESGVHFGHQTRGWNPKMARYIFAERNGIYIIDLQKTLRMLHEAYNFIQNVAMEGGSILFVGTKKQASSIVEDLALETHSDDWVYLCEDDYLHSPQAFKYISEFIENKEKYLKTSPKKKNYMNRIIGDLSNVPLIIHTPDYPDRYMPPWKRLSFIFLSKYCHWRQITNTTHTILLKSSTIKKFKKHIKASSIGPSDSKLSEKMYGRIFFKNKALCVSPIKGLSTHMTEGVMTPLIDWELVCKEYIDEMKKIGIW